ncbi:hypothetical protein EW145_g5857 [Phellinidium pouzarii]|uniref:F-box domain-containing protein n=1 Tax=Phellinidium pouzarii TaxID=167371 RepID=A0A4S4KYR6_9AGAM|nr:hypothetical protein EW145_g5857 [Phellinidium pouzarii]
MLSRAKNCYLFVIIDFIDDPAVEVPLNVLRYVQGILDTALEKNPFLNADEMQLKVAVDAKAPFSSSIESSPLVTEHYLWARPDVLPENPLVRSVLVHINRSTNIIYGLEGHANLGPYVKHLDLRSTNDTINLSFEECLIILSNFPHLEDCALRVGYSTNTLEEEELTLASLSTPHFEWEENSDIGVLLDSLIAPSLTQLKLNGLLIPRGFLPGQRWNHLLIFILRSSPALSALELTKIDCTTVDLLSCLASCKYLRRLSLENCFLDEKLMCSFLDEWHPLYEDAKRTMMGLNVLALDFCVVFDFENVLRLASSNVTLQKGAQLSALYIFPCDTIAQDVLDSIRQLPLETFEERFNQQKHV